MKLQKVMSWAAALTLVLGMVPSAMAAKYNDGHYYDINGGAAKGTATVEGFDAPAKGIKVYEVRIGSALNYPINSYNPWYREPDWTDLRYTPSGNVKEVPVEVRFGLSTDAGAEIDPSTVTVSGATNGKNANIVYSKLPATVYSKSAYSEAVKYFDNDKKGRMVNDFNADGNPIKGSYNFYHLLELDPDVVKAAGYVKDPDYPDVMFRMKGSDARYSIGYEHGDPQQRLELVEYNSDNEPNDKGGNDTSESGYQRLPVKKRYDVPTNLIKVNTDVKYNSLTVLCPVTDDLMTVTLTARAKNGNYYHDSFTVKALIDNVTDLKIASAVKTNVNSLNYSINGFTPDTVTLATNLPKGAEFAFEQTLKLNDGKDMADARYNIVNMKVTTDNASASQVRTAGFVENGKMTVYLTNPGFSAAYKVSGELADRSGTIVHRFSFIYTLTQSTGLYGSTFSVTPDVVNLTAGKTQTITAANATNDLDLSKATFTVKDATVATVTKNGASAVITGVAKGTTLVTVAVPGAKEPVIVVVNVTEDTVEPPVVDDRYVDMVVRVNTRLNVRQKASSSSSSKIIDKLYNGTLVTVDTEKSSSTWFCISYSAKVGSKYVTKTGYVSARYLDMR